MECCWRVLKSSLGWRFVDNKKDSWTLVKEPLLWRQHAFLLQYIQPANRLLGIPDSLMNEVEAKGVAECCRWSQCRHHGWLVELVRDDRLIKARAFSWEIKKLMSILMEFHSFMQFSEREKYPKMNFLHVHQQTCRQFGCYIGLHNFHKLP